jgi:hypothetical protein
MDLVAPHVWHRVAGDLAYCITAQRPKPPADASRPATTPSTRVLRFYFAARRDTFTHLGGGSGEKVVTQAGPGMACGLQNCKMQVRETPQQVRRRVTAARSPAASRAAASAPALAQQTSGESLKDEKPKE